MANFFNTEPTTTSSEFKKADAFINCYLPREDGTKVKLGAFTLHLDNQDGAAILEILQKDPKALARLQEAMQLDFRVVGEQKAGISF